MATGSVIGSFTLEIDELGWTGQDLHRPESVVAEADGTLWVSDGRGAVTRIDPTAARHCWPAGAVSPVPCRPMHDRRWEPQPRRSARR
jgi:hypothetical protein